MKFSNSIDSTKSDIWIPWPTYFLSMGLRIPFKSPKTHHITPWNLSDKRLRWSHIFIYISREHLTLTFTTKHTRLITHAPFKADTKITLAKNRKDFLTFHITSNRTQAPTSALCWKENSNHKKSYPIDYDATTPVLELT